MPKKKRSLSALALGASLFVACSNDPVESAPKLESTLEIFSWWIETGEVEALDALLGVFYDRHEGVEVTNAAAIDADTQRERLVTRLETGDPPDAFQAVSGVDTLRWLESEKLNDLDDLAESEGWAEVIPKVVLDTVSRDGHLYAVPLNIERDNNLYYSVGALEAAGVEPPTTLEDFYAVCEAIQADGGTPLAVPAAGWVLALVTIETLMPAVTGGEFYLDYFAGRANPNDPKVAELFVELEKVLRCSNVDEATGSWGDGARAVYDGDAAMLVMGDWAKGFFEGLRVDGQPVWKANEDFGVRPGLGSDGYFTFNSAVFAFPRGAPHPKAARAFLRVVGSQAGQAAFNPAKGSLPARTDVELDSFDAMTRQFGEDFQEAAAGEARLLPGYASLTPSNYQAVVSPSLLVFAVGGERAKELEPEAVRDEEIAIEPFDHEYILGKLAAAYAFLQR